MKTAASSTDAANYARPFQTHTRPAFLPLPPGAVTPEGWLRDWCLAARDGYTGHMDEYDDEFKRAWAADHTMTGERLAWPKGAWPYEGGGYWFDGLVKLGFVLHDDGLIQQANRRLDVVVDHMHADSILFLWWLNASNTDHWKALEASRGWCLWASGLLGRAMAGRYAGAGDPRVLHALEAAYAAPHDYIGIGWGMSNSLPAFETYTWTGNKQIARILTALFANNGKGQRPAEGAWDRYRYMPSDAPGAETTDHVVHFLEHTTPWALGYLWTGDRQFLDTALAWHGHLERLAMQPHGAPVSDEYYGPTGAFRGSETCDVAGYLWSQILLLTVCGDGRMADRAERVFFNAGPAVMSRDFKTHVYFQTPNRMVDMFPPHTQGPRAEGNSYAPTHYPLCCTAALNRILPNYVMHMWMATYDNGLAAAHYGPCRVSALVADGVQVELTCRTEYPFDETIEIAVDPERGARFALSFRIPGWCESPDLSVNGASVGAGPDARGFVRVERLWRRGDAVSLRFPMTPRVDTGRDDNAKGAPYASVSCGPLLFALPIADVDGPNAPDPEATWRYALDSPNGDGASGLRLERQPMPATWDWPLAAPVRVHAKVAACDWNPSSEAPLPEAPVAASGPAEQATLVPYGCTKFRVSMLPVTERLLQQSMSGGKEGESS